MIFRFVYFLIGSWVLCLCISFPPGFLSWPTPLVFRPDTGSCSPDNIQNSFFPSVYFAAGFLLPILVIIGELSIKSDARTYVRIVYLLYIELQRY